MQLNIPINKQEIFIKSTMWNTIIEVFKGEKNMDITSYMISVQLRWKTVLVKTNKPIINTEALMLDDKIKLLKNVDKTSIFRGKFTIEFLRSILEQIKADRMSKSPKYFVKKGKVKINFSQNNITSDLSQYADTPQELFDFLAQLAKQKCLENS